MYFKGVAYDPITKTISLEKEKPGFDQKNRIKCGYFLNQIGDRKADHDMTEWAPLHLLSNQR